MDKCDLAKSADNYYTVMGNKIQLPFAYFVNVLVSDLVRGKDVGETVVLKKLKLENPLFDNIEQMKKLLRKLRLELDVKDGHFKVVSEDRTLLSGVYAKTSQVRSLTCISEVKESEKGSKLSRRHIYRELSLRGYQASRGLQVIEVLDFEVTEAKIANSSLFARLEAMIQMQLLVKPLLFGKRLFQPLWIDELVVTVEQVDDFNKKPNLVAVKEATANTFSSTFFIQMSGLILVAANTGAHEEWKPVLERCCFIPHFERVGPLLSLSDARVRERLIRPSFTIAMTNCPDKMMVVDEICFDDQPLAEELSHWFDVFNTKRDFGVLLKSTVVSEKSIEKVRLLEEPNRNPFLLVIKCVRQLRRQLSGESLAEQADKLLNVGSFLLAVMNNELALSFTNRLKQSKDNYISINHRQTPTVAVMLLRKVATVEGDHHSKVFELDGQGSYKWVETLQKKLNAGDERVWLRSSDQLSGFNGLVHCLRHEQGGQAIRGLFTPGQAESSIPEYIYKMNLAINIHLEGEWGVFQNLMLLGDDYWKDGVVKRSRKQNFLPHKVYIVTGGLCGVDLQLCRWLVAAGARKLVVTSRSCPKTSYQHFCLWQMRQSAEVVVFEESLADESGCRRLIEKSLEVGPIGGLFHLAVFLTDGLLRKPTPESFRVVCEASLGIAARLARAVSAAAPDIDHFVLFSSSVASRGAFEVASYAYVKSALEQLCRQRGIRSIKAIQWAAIGLSQQMTDLMVESGLLPFDPMFDILDKFLSRPEPILSCVVMADKQEKCDI